MPTIRRYDPQSGNVIVFILMAVVLIGIVTAAIRSGGGERANIDQEQLVIRAAEIRQHAAEFERAVAFLLQNGTSEYDIRFAHADAPSSYGNPATNPQNQVFARQGGGAAYRRPPAGIQVTPGSWQFYGNSALPQVGSSRPDLVAVLPNITADFCAEINRANGYAAGVVPTDPNPICIHTGSSAYFTNADGTPGTQDDFNTGSTNVIPAGSFIMPATQGCLRCDDASLHFFHVLLAR